MTPWRLYVAVPVNGGPAKIGITTSPQRRKWALKRAGFGVVRIVWMSRASPYACAAEALVKRRHRVRGVLGDEWFDVRPDALANSARKALKKARRNLGDAWRAWEIEMRP